jgi:signal peptidase II
MFSRLPRPFFYVTIILVLIVDHFTKAWTMAAFHPGQSLVLIPDLFSLTYVQNTGIAFGMFKGQGLLVALFVTAIAIAAFYYSRDVNWARLEPNLVGGALVGGALGNMFDRVRLGYVVDFFDVHAGTYQWPVFNVADSLICLAVAWIVIRQLRTQS